MTIKVCHNQFNKVLSIIGKICLKIIFFTILGWFCFSIFSLITTNYIELPSFGDLEYLEKIELYRDQFYMRVLNSFGVLVGGVSIIIVGFLIPSFNDEPNWLLRVNNKLKLFKWNEDC